MRNEYGADGNVLCCPRRKIFFVSLSQIFVITLAISHLLNVSETYIYTYNITYNIIYTYTYTYTYNLSYNL